MATIHSCHSHPFFIHTEAKNPASGEIFQYFIKLMFQRLFWLLSPLNYRLILICLSICLIFGNWGSIWTRKWLMMSALVGSDCGHKPEWLLHIFPGAYLIRWCVCVCVWQTPVKEPNSENVDISNGGGVTGWKSKCCSWTTPVSVTLTHTNTLRHTQSFSLSLTLLTLTRPLTCLMSFLAHWHSVSLSE